MKYLLILIIAIQAITIKAQTLGEYVSQAKSLITLEKSDEANVLLTKALAAFPNSDTLNYCMGLVKTDFQNEHLQAIKYFEKAIEINPKFAFGYFGIGKANMELDSLDKAIVFFNKSLELSPNTFETNYNLAYSYYQKGWTQSENFKKAIPYYSKAIELNPDYLRSYFERAVTFFQLNKYENAFNDFNYYDGFCIKENKDSSFYFYYALNSYHLKKYFDAIDQFNEYYKIDSLEPDFLYYRGLSNYYAGNSNEAIEDFKKYEINNPDDIEILYYIAKASLISEDIDRAYVTFHKAASLGDKESLKQFEKLKKGNFNKINSKNLNISYNIFKPWSYDNFATPSVSACEGIIINEPYNRFKLALFKNDSLSENPNAACDMWGQWFNNKGEVDEIKTSTYKWSRLISTDIWNENETTYPIKVWKLTPKKENNNIILYIWGKPEILTEFEYLFEEFIESINFQ